MDNELLAKGTLLFHGTYRIEGKLGQGGFGITYLATDVALDKHVAIKEFFPNTYCKRDTSTSRVGVATEGSREFVTKLKLKFLKEARNIAKLDHPNIVRLHAAFEENDTAYYVMDYIEGTPLSQIVKTHGSLDRQKAVEYTTLIGNALIYLHERRINHLDVKPANIMVRRSDGVPVLIDFGLAKQYDCEGQQTTSTPVGFSQGFAPVEQYKPGGVKEFSPASDLYSLAATLYFMLSGRIPPPATDLIDKPLTFSGSFPSFLKKPIEKAMSPSRQRRHATVEQFLREINPDRQAPPPSPEEDTTFEDTVFDPKVVPTSDKVVASAGTGGGSVNKPEPTPVEADSNKEKAIKKKGNYIFLLGIVVIPILLAFIILNKSCHRSSGGSDTDSLAAAGASALPFDYTGEADGHQYVDLGLPSGTLWAACNLGAVMPWDAGEYFYWGDATPVDPFGDNSSHEYPTVLEDFTAWYWGEAWRTPTVEDFRELLDNTELTWTEMEGVKGARFTGKNRESIFIPCTYRTAPDKEHPLIKLWTANAVNLGANATWYYMFYGTFGSGKPVTGSAAPYENASQIRPVMSP